MPIVNGKAAAQKQLGNLLVPGNSVSWTASAVTSTALGRPGLCPGNLPSSMKDPDGKAVADTGKYLEVWKKQVDGSWKAVADMWSSDLPAVAPAPAKGKKKKG